jgi:hypothetical protein
MEQRLVKQNDNQGGVADFESWANPTTLQAAMGSLLTDDGKHLYRVPEMELPVNRWQGEVAQAARAKVLRSIRNHHTRMNPELTMEAN